MLFLPPQILMAKGAASKQSKEASKAKSMSTSSGIRAKQEMLRGVGKKGWSPFYLALRGHYLSCHTQTGTQVDKVPHSTKLKRLEGALTCLSLRVNNYPDVIS